MKQALTTVESPVNTGKIWWARLGLNLRPLPPEGSALRLGYAINRITKPFFFASTVVLRSSSTRKFTPVVAGL